MGPVLLNFEKRMMVLRPKKWSIHNSFVTESVPKFTSLPRNVKGGKYDTFTHPGKERLCFGISCEMNCHPADGITVKHPKINCRGILLTHLSNIFWQQSSGSARQAHLFHAVKRLSFFGRFWVAFFEQKSHGK